MTLLELVKELNDLVETDLVMAQEEVNLWSTRITLDNDEVITFGDDEDEYCDDVDESFYNPYMGCECYDDGGFFEDF